MSERVKRYKITFKAITGRGYSKQQTATVDAYSLTQALRFVAARGIAVGAVRSVAIK